MRRAAFSIIILLGLVAPAWGQADVGYEAYKRGDYATAHRVWNSLAEGGDASAQYNLGLLYHRGLGVERRLSEAAKWYGRAAENGDAEAQKAIGDLYVQGFWGKKNSAKAATWYRMAAEHGHAEAKKSLRDLEAQQYSSKIDRLLSKKRVAFVSSRGVSPNEFWNRLKAAGVDMRNFSPAQLQSVVLFKPHIIIIDYDTSRAWRRQPKEVIRGILSNERLIGFGNGGAYLFRILGSNIGLGDVMHSPGNFQLEIPTVPDEVLEAPEIPTIVTVHSPDTSTDAIGVYARGSPAISAFSGIARWVRHGQHWPIARQGNLLLWGFDAPLGTLTKEGKQLLLHLLVDHMHRSFRHYSKLFVKQTFVQPGILEDSLVPQLPSDIWYFNVSRTGKIRAKLVWDPETIALALILSGLDGQERVAFARRDGQSPISLEYQVTSSDLARADKWKLAVVRFRNFSVSEINYKLILEFPN